MTPSLNILVFPEQIRFRVPALVALVIVVFLPSEEMGVLLCPFSFLFDLPCPACGLTRSMSSLLHLELGKSFFFHPLGGLVVLFLVTCLFTNRPDRLVWRVHLNERFQIPVFTLRNVVVLFLAVWCQRMVLSVTVL